MLKRAIQYKSQINNLFIEASDNPKNRFFTQSYWEYIPKITESNWTNQQMVSVDKSDNVIGWLEAEISVKQHYINNLSVIRFRDDERYNYTFSKDFHEFFAKLFMHYEYRKINYNSVVDSPNEKWYDEFTMKYGGRIVGVKKEHFAMENGKLCDLKIYELFRNEFLNTMIYKYPKVYSRHFSKFNLKG